MNKVIRRVGDCLKGISLLAQRPSEYNAEVDEYVVLVDEKTIRVNLDFPPRIPLERATVETNIQGGWVEVQRREDGLYVSGRKVLMFLSEPQKEGKKISGHDLWDELSSFSVIHPNVGEALLKYPHLIPEEFERDVDGNTIYLGFWGATFRFQGGVWVRIIYRNQNKWDWDLSTLEGVFTRYAPVLILSPKGNLPT